MSKHKENETILEATVSESEYESEFNSKSEAISNRKELDPVDFLIVTRIPEKSFKFQWIIRKFSTLPKNQVLHSTRIYALATSCYQLMLVKNEHGFGLFHVSHSKEKNTENIPSNQARTCSFGFTKASKGSIFGQATFEYAQDSGSVFTFGKDSGPGFALGQDSGSGFSHTQDSKSEFAIKIEYQISTTDSKAKELMKWSVCFSDDSESKNCKIGEYINNTLEIFPDDSLILDCNLKVTLMPISEEIPISFMPSLECHNWKKLSMDLKALYQNLVDTDVTLIVGNEKIRAHKLILTARSAIFKKIFDHDMKEAEQNSVDITDVQFPALRGLVEFLYTGVIKNKNLDLQNLFDLYYAADKYEVMDLREMVGNTLLGRIQMDNASEILTCADRHNDKELKSKVMNFIRVNFENVANTNAWKSCALHRPRLAMEVVNFYFKKRKGMKAKCETSLHC